MAPGFSFALSFSGAGYEIVASDYNGDSVQDLIFKAPSNLAFIRHKKTNIPIPVKGKSIVYQ